MGLMMGTSTVVRRSVRSKITDAERRYLSKGLNEPGGKLPLFDGRGQEISPRVIKGCIEKGLAERWFANPMKPNWLVCRLTDAGRHAAS